MSGISCPEQWAYDKIYTSPNGLQLFFRDDILSNKISFKDISAKEFVKEIKDIFQPDEDLKTKSTKVINRYLITAMDGETFGHHIPNYEKTFLRKVLDLISNEEKLQTIFISELDQHFPLSNKKVVHLNSSKVVEVYGKKFVEGLKYEREGKVKDMKVQGIFVEIGLIAKVDFAKSVKKNKWGEIMIHRSTKTHEENMTSVPGIFAAGDVEMGPSTVVEAIGRGHDAAKGINAYLQKNPNPKRKETVKTLQIKNLSPTSSISCHEP